jgi:hypothetical protein
MLAKPTRLAVIFLTLAAGLAAAAQDKAWGSFDRVLLTKNFLDAIYPDLKQTQGLIVLRTGSGTRDEIDVFPCHPGSGVGQAGRDFVHCIGLYPAGPSEFLTTAIGFVDEYPIWQFSIGGSFVHAKSVPVEKEIIPHPEWKEEQMIDALRPAHPRFGPDNKQEFLRTLPVEVIFKFTGCRLEPDTVVLHAFRQEGKPEPSIAATFWRVTGTRKAGKINDSCVARFEPFDAKLIGIDRM